MYGGGGRGGYGPPPYMPRGGGYVVSYLSDPCASTDNAIGTAAAIADVLVATTLTDVLCVPTRRSTLDCSSSAHIELSPGMRWERAWLKRLGRNAARAGARLQKFAFVLRGLARVKIEELREWQSYNVTRAGRPYCSKSYMHQTASRGR